MNDIYSRGLPRLPPLLRLVPHPVGSKGNTRGLRMSSPGKTVLVEPKDEDNVSISVLQLSSQDISVHKYNLPKQDEDFKKTIFHAITKARALQRFSPQMDGLADMVRGYPSQRSRYEEELGRLEALGVKPQPAAGARLADFSQSEVELGLIDQITGENRVFVEIKQPVSSGSDEWFKVDLSWWDDGILRVAYYNQDYEQIEDYRPIVDEEIPALENVLKTWRMHCIPETTFGWDMDNEFFNNLV